MRGIIALNCAVMIRSVIVGTGSHIPSVVVPNDAFLQHEFRGADHKRIPKSNAEILKQFAAITGIRERRYVPDDVVTSDIASDAAERALDSSGIDRETLDYIIVAHNFGDVRAGTTRSDMVPALAARVKSRLKIENPRTVAYDLVFGCPGWLQGVIQADYMIRTGDVKRAMIIGADTLSRISDPHDRDSLIYADGAGAVILEGQETDGGILSHAARSDTIEHSKMLYMGHSFNREAFLESLFLKMEGRKLYKYALNTVATAVKEALDRAGLTLDGVNKVLIHQANGKMDEAILGALYKLYDAGEPPPDMMPMTISWLGNSSVATIPTLLDLISKGEMKEHSFAPGDVIVFASVGAGMHINAAVYRVPAQN
jgi:3-oxoacyl-[acyl-carrier-protein] synthase-3